MPLPARRRLPIVAAASAATAALTLGATPVGATPPGHSVFATGGFADAALARQWYDITTSTVAAAAFPEPVTQSDTFSVSWLAAARAVESGHSAPYQQAAFVQALHDTLVALVPSQRSQLDADLASSLGAVPDSTQKSAGISAGTQQASSALAQRANDGLSTAAVDTAYTPPPAGPGVWQPTPPAYQPAVRASEGKGTPYLLAAGNQFDPGPPPALDSATYQQSAAETAAYGRVDSTARDAGQTDVAKFWEPAINVQYVQFVGQLISDEPEYSLAWDARFVAAFNAVTVDAQIAIYNAKFEYAFWRPVTAIRAGSPGVPADPSFTPLFTTPRYPEYPSGHGGVAGAAQEVLTAFFGPDAPATVSATSPTDQGSTRSYGTWAAITQEVVDARVWEGIHFRFSDLTGVDVGAKVADYDLGRIDALGL